MEPTFEALFSSQVTKGFLERKDQRLRTAADLLTTPQSQRQSFSSRSLKDEMPCGLPQVLCQSFEGLQLRINARSGTDDPTQIRILLPVFSVCEVILREFREVQRSWLPAEANAVTLCKKKIVQIPNQLYNFFIDNVLYPTESNKTAVNTVLKRNFF